MPTEIENILSALKAEIRREILNHRGADAGLVKSFAVNCRAHRGRVATRLRNMRADGRELAAIDAAAWITSNFQ
jgi:hypothetical protein